MGVLTKFSGVMNAHCTYSCRWKSYFNRHRLIHNTHKPFKCPECNYATRYKQHLQIHQRAHAIQNSMGAVCEPNIRTQLTLKQ